MECAHVGDHRLIGEHACERPANTRWQRCMFFDEDAVSQQLGTHSDAGPYTEDDDRRGTVDGANICSQNAVLLKSVRLIDFHQAVDLQGDDQGSRAVVSLPLRLLHAGSKPRRLGHLAELGCGPAHDLDVDVGRGEVWSGFLKHRRKIIKPARDELGRNEQRDGVAPAIPGQS